MRPHKDEEATDSVRDDEGRDRKRDKIKDKVAAGIGIAAGAIGLGAAVSSREGKEDDQGERSPTKTRRGSDEDRRRDSDGSEGRGSKSTKSTAPRDSDPVIVEPARERERERLTEERPADLDRDKTRDRDRRAAEAALTVEPVSDPSREQSTSGEDVKRSSRFRRRRASSAFNPNDAAGILALKAKLSANEDKEKVDEQPVVKPPSPQRRSPPTEVLTESPVDETALVPVEDDPRGRELVPQDEKQVRVVSPPRDDKGRKPVKGILKNPKTQFPEDPNPIREGVAPHKDDKTKANVPTGARWTKINRQLVNPEALTIGKERFEVRENFVIVLRVLSKEEIQAYATATSQLRGMYSSSRSHQVRFIADDGWSLQNGDAETTRRIKRK
jgi:hypothetical protein